MRSADRAFSQSAFGRLHRTINQTLKSPKRTQSRIAKLAKLARRPKPAQMAKALVGVDPTHLVKEIRKYARGDQLAASLVNEFLNSLGPAGAIIRALASGTTEEPDLDAMADVLRSRGYTVLPPEEAPGMARGGVPRSAKGRAAEEARQEPARISTTGRPAEEVREAVGKIRPKGRPVRKTKTVQLPMASGRYKRFDRTHPIVTGEMVKASSSTNVHSFGYRLDTWTLFVRFWAGSGKQKHAGPLYSYFQVEPEKFLEMYKVRGAGNRHTPGVKSPGTFVWERLRILGTISGHQKDYKLVGVARGYVPRKAVFAQGGEEYRPRIFRTVEGDVLRSELPAGRPGFGGAPNRGAPNRGQPNTGRP